MKGTAMKISNVLTTAPTTEIATTAQMDTFLRGDGALDSVDSDLLTSLIQSAREYIELHTGRALITQTWTMFMDAFPKTEDSLGWWDGVRIGSITQGDARSFELPIGPLQSVTSISTFDNDNTETTFDADHYFLNTAQTPGEVILNTGATWPVFTRNRQGVKVVYVAGYGDLVTDVPSPLRTATKQLAAHWYENREFTKTQSDMNQAVAPVHLQSIINRYKVRKL
jgi:hypothetical protein